MRTVVDSVPFLDLTSEFQQLEQEWLNAIRKTGKTGSFVLGPNVEAFEEELAAYIGVKYAVSVANGTDALILSLRALGVGPGDEVITTPYTFYATSEAIDVVGARPVFADILADSFNIDPAGIRARLTSKTRAIIPVHLFGFPAAMDEIMAIAREHGLVVIEDGAQAFGAKVNGACVGSIGDSGCFSFYPTKVLGCYGDGGMVTTNSAEIAAHLRRLRNHGAVRPFVHTEVGYNSRLDEIQAALLRMKLRGVEAAIAGRRRVAAAYTERLAGTDVVPPGVPAHGEHVYNLYTIRVPERDRVRQRLTDHHIASSLCYPEPLHRQEIYASLGYGPGSLSVSEQTAREALSLPIYPDMPPAHIERVCEVLLTSVVNI